MAEIYDLDFDVYTRIPRGASSPPKPALHIDEPKSTTRGITRSAIFVVD
jgi:hypothetical protein